ncbi:MULTISPECIES: hypothetical protein [unclassified Micromonospora]|nr:MULTISPECIES: hypothetical protein [unclassified Micromonospora]MDG4819253.1 hypothetical protein [Micromonospora sp. WMMD956]WFE55715.1 hypothetical protein O7633_02060 [Micromonospora sp. WMMD712]
MSVPETRPAPSDADGRRPRVVTGVVVEPDPHVDVDAARRADAYGGSGFFAGPVIDVEPGRRAAPRRRPVLGVVGVGVILALLAVGAFALAAGPPGLRAAGTGPAVGGGGPAAGGGLPHTVTAPLGGRSRAAFELVTGTTAVDLRLADLGADLYRISTPVDGDSVPRPVRTAEGVALHLTPTGRAGPGAVQIRLTSRVAWRLVMGGGASTQLLDLRAGRLTGVDLAGGTDRTELRLPAAAGSLAVRLTAGANQLTVTVPDLRPVRVRAVRGAGSVTVHAERRVGVAGGAVIATPGWETATDRLDLDLVGGAEAVTVLRR